MSTAYAIATTHGLEPAASPSTHGSSRVRHGWAAIGLIGWLLVALFAMANSAEAAGNFEVRSAYTSLRDGVVFLNAQIHYDLPDGAEGALRSGVTLDLVIQIEVERNRRFLPDRTVASLRQRYTLSYHALSDRYVVRNVNSGEQGSFATLEDAREELGDLRDLPVIDDGLLRDGSAYEMRIRAVLDRQRLPVPISTLASLFDDWRLASNWFTWRLTSAD
ncbi:MAG: DUF4390 domain-containing protein [Pseudomonadota bacterium]